MMAALPDLWTVAIAVVSTFIAFVGLCVPVTLYVHTRIVQSTEKLAVQISNTFDKLDAKISLEKESASRLRHEQAGVVQRTISDLDARIRVVEKLPDKTDLEGLEKSFDRRFGEMWEYMRALGTKMDKLTGAINGGRVGRGDTP
jgi:hypothetical protein